MRPASDPPETNYPTSRVDLRLWAPEDLVWILLCTVSGEREAKEDAGRGQAVLPPLPHLQSVLLQSRLHSGAGIPLG